MREKTRVLGLLALLAGLVTPFTNCSVTNGNDGIIDSQGLCFENCSAQDSLVPKLFFNNQTIAVFEDQSWVEFGGYCNEGGADQLIVAWRIREISTNAYSYPYDSYGIGRIEGEANGQKVAFYYSTCENGTFNISIPTAPTELVGKEIVAQAFQQTSTGLVADPNGQPFYPYFTSATVTK